jgi:hypothetical protein
VEAYIELLRACSPDITWKVRAFHYESFFQLVQKILTRSEYKVIKPPPTTTKSRPGIFRRKVITSKASGSFKYATCVDKTMAGIWDRSRHASLSKLVLSNVVSLDRQTAEDYLTQQSRFVRGQAECDEYAEFSTCIHLEGFRPRLLAVKSLKQPFTPFLFWVCTFLGLTVPFRKWFDSYCDEIRVSVVKEASMDPPQSAASRGLNKLYSRFVKSDSQTTDDESFRTIMRGLRLYDASSKNGEDVESIIEDVVAARIGTVLVNNDSSLPVVLGDETESPDLFNTNSTHSTI